MSRDNLDAVDAVLLQLLQRNGRVSQHDLARAVGLSAPAVADRLRKLEERGVIVGYTALLDAERLGRGVTAFIAVGMSGSRHYGAFRARVEEENAIAECHSVTGDASHLLKVRVRSTGELESLLGEIQSWPGVQWTKTSVVMSAVKETTAIPLEEELLEGSPVAGSGSGASQLLHVPFRHHT
jgi:Lrp/AsnC family transcriptional regulator, leucine-responsive regulatory protein